MILINYYVQRGKSYFFISVLDRMYESRSYVFPGAVGNSKLHAVLVENNCWLVGFIYENILVALRWETKKKIV